MSTITSTNPDSNEETDPNLKQFVFARNLREDGNFLLVEVDPVARENWKVICRYIRQNSKLRYLLEYHMQSVDRVMLIGEGSHD